jgi:outer membrane receptor protein involved in Fe transport
MGCIWTMLSTPMFLGFICQGVLFLLVSNLISGGYGNGVGFRGASNNFDGQGYKVYLNGIPITDAEGTTIMDDIDFGSVGNVEVIKGPAGSLYGLAIAGAVNLQTKKADRGNTSISQQAMVGSLRTSTIHYAASNWHGTFFPHD